MDITKYYSNPNEKPLDVIKPDGGFFRIFRTFACVGDSLASGEMESMDKDGNTGYHDYYDYSWGQFMARAAGNTAYNFSRGGMTAREYCLSFADANGFWDQDKACQAYIIALGVNDILNMKWEIGSVEDIDFEDPDNNKETFVGFYAKIIQKYRKISPKSRMFLVTIPHLDPVHEEYIQKHSQALYSIAEKFEFTYVIDLTKYSPPHDEKFKKNFYMAGHLNPAGYLLLAEMMMSYIDWIIRNEPGDFAQTAFIGKGGVHNVNYPW